MQLHVAEIWRMADDDVLKFYTTDGKESPDLKRITMHSLKIAKSSLGFLRICVGIFSLRRSGLSI